MKTKLIRIPLIGTMTQRGVDGYTTLVTNGKDQRYRGMFFNVINNAVTRSSAVFAEKRPGLRSAGTIAAGQLGTTLSDDHLVTVFNNLTVFTVFYNDITNCGTIVATEVPVWIRKVAMGGEIHYMISGNNGSWGYYLPVAATAIATTFTGDVTDTSAVIINVSSTSGLYVGQLLSGTGINAASRIQSIDSSSQITMTVVATATNAGVTITRTHLAKIIDADFPGNTRGPFIDMNGRLYIIDANGDIFGSDINNIVGWTTTNKIRANLKPDVGIGLFKFRGLIGAMCSTHIEFFQDAGNSSGSQLSRTYQYSEIGNAGSVLEAGDNILSETGDQLATEADDELISEGEFADLRSYYFIGDYVFFYGQLGGQSGIWMISDWPPKKISGPSQDYVINSSGVVQSIEPFAAASGIYLQVRNGANYALLYHVETGVWGESALTAGTMIAPDANAISVTGTGGKRLQLDFGGGNTFQDDGASFTATIQLGRNDYGTGSRKQVHYYELDSDAQSSGTATLEVSDDDFASWTTVGEFDMTIHNPRIYAGGSFKGSRAERITHSANTAFRASYLSVSLSIAE